MMTPLKAPFPWFGGKSRAASLVWERFGDVKNYVEPFAGSLAVLLSRPSPPNVETVNDKDAYLANFWRAIQWAPDETARWADSPVNEADILARHKWLLRTGAKRLELLREDPEFYDAKIAGWWVWGLCAWIGSGWCRQRADGRPWEQLPHLGNAGMGINRKLPHLGNAGRGINRKLPHLGDAGRGEHIREYFGQLAARLRDVRIACGEWDRILTPSCTTRHAGITGVFLDPPYTDGDLQYSAGGCGGTLASAVCEWAIEHGGDPKLRIALCGYKDEHKLPRGWKTVAWKAQGGYGSTKAARENAARERIWFSPHCLAGGSLALAA
jgi:DNA adenine methylase